MEALDGFIRATSRRFSFCGFATNLWSGSARESARDAGTSHRSGQPRTTGWLKRARNGPGRGAGFWRLNFLVRTVLAHCCVSANWFTRFKQSRKPLDLCGLFRGITSTVGCTEFSGGTVFVFALPDFRAFTARFAQKNFSILLDTHILKEQAHGEVSAV